MPKFKDLLTEEVLSNAKIALFTAKFRLLSDDKYCYFWPALQKVDFIVDKTGSVKTIAIDKYYRIIYNPLFINQFNIEQIEALLLHEICHKYYKHFIRVRPKNEFERTILNIAEDIEVNTTLLLQDVPLPEKFKIYEVDKEGNVTERETSPILPNIYEDKATIKIANEEITIEKVRYKSAERIYRELMEKIQEKMEENPDFARAIQQAMEGRAKIQMPSPYDEHNENPITEENIEEAKKRGDITDEEAKVYEKYRKENEQKTPEEEAKEVDMDRTTGSSYTRTRGRGKGFEEIFELKLYQPKLDWRLYIKKFISSQIKTDYQWVPPSRRSFVLDLILPSMKKGKKLKCVLLLDSSGSIDDKEMNIFISETIHLFKIFNVEAIVLFHTTEIEGEPLKVKSYDAETVFKTYLRRRVTGGTSHIQPLKYIEEKYKNYNMAISFTDMYSEFPEVKPRIQSILFVAISKRDSLSELKAHVQELPNWIKSSTIYYVY